jgi:cobalt-zinc-cadmium resistance protein CzcA
VIGAAALLGVALFVFTLLGKEFLPELDEGDIWLRVRLPIGISLEGARPYVREIRERLLRFPEVRVVVSQTGAPDDGTDPNGPDNNEFYVGLHPRVEWRIRDKDRLIETMNAALGNIPGITLNFSQPIKDNVDEALSGVKGELAIKLFGPDLFLLQQKAEEIARILSGIRGVKDLDYDRLVGQPQLRIAVDRAATARYGISIQDVQDAVEAATKGRVVTAIFEGERRFGLAVRLRADGGILKSLRRLTVSAPGGERILLTQLAELTESDGFATILREGNERRIGIKWNVRERDMGGLVDEAMRKVHAAVTLPEGYRVVWSGHFEDQQRAISRLYIIVPLVLFIIFVLLFSAFQSLGDSLLIMLNLPFAIIGGTFALYLWGTNFSISAAVGYIAVFGVSVLDGVVLVSFIRQAVAEDRQLRDAIVKACDIRFRPIIVTAIVAILGFMPAALSHGIGSEIQRPLARVVIGGLVSATAMTLLVLPAIYELLARRLERRRQTPRASPA